MIIFKSFYRKLLSTHLPIILVFFSKVKITVAKEKAKADKVKEIFGCITKNASEIHKYCILSVIFQLF